MPRHRLPVGLGPFGRLAPIEFAATAIAAWFMTAFFGNLAAGAVGALWSAVPVAEFFAIVAALAAVSGVLLLVLSPWANRTERRASAPTPDPAYEAAPTIVLKAG